MRGVIVSKANTPRSYLIKDTNGVVYRRNTHHLKKTKYDTTSLNNNTFVDTEQFLGTNSQVRQKRLTKMPAYLKDYVK